MGLTLTPTLSGGHGFWALILTGTYEHVETNIFHEFSIQQCIYHNTRTVHS